VRDDPSRSGRAVKITAAVVETEGAFALQDVDPGYLRADEVLVEVVASGICPTGLTAPRRTRRCCSPRAAA
jgi:D-arabinose 1-dehydrogenase-like Zn-dependent alcohol dehydrogenase